MKQILLAAPLALAACTTPAAYSSPVGIRLAAKSSDVASSTLTEIKEIQTESGNPYGAFTNAATAQLGGKQPSRLEVTDATLSLGPSGVATLEQVLTGDVDVAFVVNATGDVIDAAQITSPMGAGPDTMTVTFDWDNVAAADRPGLLGGGFKVLLRGPAAASFSSANASADLRVTLTFEASE